MAQHTLTLDSPTADTLAQGGSRPAVIRFVELTEAGTPIAVLHLPYAEFLEMGSPGEITLDPQVSGG